MVQMTEHVSKKILERCGLPVPLGTLAISAQEAEDAIARLGLAYPVAMKAELPVGGRGKAGAVVRVEDPTELLAAFEKVTGTRLNNVSAHSVRIEPWANLRSEWYMAVTIDPTECRPVLILSTEGGIDVEQSADDARFYVPLTNYGRVPDAAFRSACYDAGIEPDLCGGLLSIARGCVRAFFTYDAKLVEINPIGLIEKNLTVIDASMVVDDWALFRQPEISRWVVESGLELVEERVRRQTALEYVRLEGAIGLISGGAGLTMAVMDLIQDLGGAPACFLDCSANPTVAGYRAAFELMKRDEQVNSILVSIFGGGTQVDRVASTIVEVLSGMNIEKPIAMRVAGTNVDAATAILSAAGYENFASLEDSVRDAIEKSKAA